MSSFLSQKECLQGTQDFDCAPCAVPCRSPSALAHLDQLDSPARVEGYKGAGSDGRSSWLVVSPGVLAEAIKAL